MSGQAPLGVSGGLDGDDNYDFEALYSSIEASIDRKKERTHQVALTATFDSALISAGAESL